MVFLQKFDPTGKEPTQSEGYCLICAKQLGIGPVSDMLEKWVSTMTSSKT